MTNFRRALERAVVNTAARKIVALAIVAIAAAVGYSSNAKADVHATRPEAYAHCQTTLVQTPGDEEQWCEHHAATPPDLSAYWKHYRRLSSGSTGILGEGHNYSADCAAGQVWFEGSHSCAQSCGSRPDFISTPTYQMRNGTVSCTDGCEVAHFANGDGTYTGKPSVMSNSCEILPDCEGLGGGYYLNTSSGMCEPPPSECESNQTKGPGGTCVDACPSGMHQAADGTCEQDDDNCPAGEIRAPSGACLPGEGQCAAGEAKKKDGTCGRDSDGDGVADDDDEDPENDTDKEQFSGGDNCDNPPSCSGSLILCGQARIQWRIDCNTRKDIKISGGSCDAVPLCVGKNCNAMEYSQLLMQWRTSCKAVGEGSGGEGGQPEWTKVGGMSQDGGAGETAEDLKGVELIEFDTDDLDQSGFGGAASCPALFTGSATGMGSEFVQQLASPPAIFCTWVGAVKVIMILFGTIIAAFITVRMH